MAKLHYNIIEILLMEERKLKSKEYETQKEKVLNNPRYANKQSPTTKKSKHKHEYIEVLLLLKRQNPIYSNEVEEKAYRTRVCAHCGKIQGIDLMEAMHSNNGRFYIALDRPTMLERYPNHLKFDLGDHVYKKYYDLDRQGVIDIRTMYKEQVKAFLPGDYIVADSDIDDGLLNNIQPEEMANKITTRNNCVS